MITGIHHIALRCHGLEQYNRAVHFYCDLLGLKLYTLFSFFSLT